MKMGNQGIKNPIFKDLTGIINIYGIKIISLDHFNNGFSYWKCLCHCGTEFIAIGSLIKNNKSQSCGHNCKKKHKRIIKNPRFVDKQKTIDNLKLKLIGKKFNRWTVLDYVGKIHRSHSMWLCKCDCGKEKIINKQSLFSGMSKSCGCLLIEKRKEIAGPLHPRWNPLLTDLERDQNYTRTCLPKYRSWSISVKEFYNWICQKCDKRDRRNVHSHHLYGWDKYVDLRYKLFNGTCLCKSCHDNFHNKFGYGNNDINQYLNFIEGDY